MTYNQTPPSARYRNMERVLAAKVISMGNWKSTKYAAIISTASRNKLPEEVQLRFTTRTGEKITHRVIPQIGKDVPFLIEVKK